MFLSQRSVSLHVGVYKPNKKKLAHKHIKARKTNDFSSCIAGCNLIITKVFNSLSDILIDFNFVYAIWMKLIFHTDILSSEFYAAEQFHWIKLSIEL